MDFDVDRPHTTYADQGKERWTVAYLADQCVQLPNPEHEPGSCEECDTLRAWIQEVEDTAKDSL